MMPQGVSSISSSPDIDDKVLTPLLVVKDGVLLNVALFSCVARYAELVRKSPLSSSCTDLNIEQKDFTGSFVH